MEESATDLKVGKLSFAPRRCSMTFSKRERSLASVNPSIEEKKHPLDIPSSTLQAMEYLSRSWSPSSSDFFRILSFNSLLPAAAENGMPEQQDGKIEEEEANKAVLLGCRDNRLNPDGIWTCPQDGRPATTSKLKHKTHMAGWINIGRVKAWLIRGDHGLLGSLSRRGREKRKEELRLHTAQVHAALSVAQLAAAVAGALADGSGLNPPAAGGVLDDRMGAVAASAAALVATVCAEAAESSGATRAHIASAINAGLASRTRGAMLALTATAATCLRGAATLKLRATSSDMSHVQEEGQQLLADGAELPVRAPHGKIHIRMVRVYTKHDKLMLGLGKRYLQGALTTYKQYRIIKTDGEEGGSLIKDDDICGFCWLTLGTTGGTVEVLFDDDRRMTIWRSTIAHLLHRSGWPQ